VKGLNHQFLSCHSNPEADDVENTEITRLFIFGALFLVLPEPVANVSDVTESVWQHCDWIIEVY
jgi:hypothetical protein